MALILVGVATRYVGEVGAPLYTGEDTYREHGVPFVALPPDAYGRQVEAGDLVWLEFEDGSALLAQALDAGDFGPGTGKYVRDWGRRPIVADVPNHWATWVGMSVPVRVYVVEGLAR